MNKRWYTLLVLLSSLLIILGILSFICFLGYRSEGGAPSVKATRETVQAWVDQTKNTQNLKAALLGYDTRERDLVYTVQCLQVWVLVLSSFCLGTGVLCFAITSRARSRGLFQQIAPPNGGPVTVVGNPGVTEGPPSAS